MNTLKDGGQHKWFCGDHDYDHRDEKGQQPTNTMMATVKQMTMLPMRRLTGVTVYGDG